MGVRILNSLYPRVPNINTSRLRGRKLQETRKRIFAAHQYRCAACGRMTVHLELDHIVPLGHGNHGTNDDSNLQPLCTDKVDGQLSCHQKKTNQERTSKKT